MNFLYEYAYNVWVITMYERSGVIAVTLHILYMLNLSSSFSYFWQITNLLYIYHKSLPKKGKRREKEQGYIFSLLFHVRKRTCRMICGIWRSEYFSPLPFLECVDNTILCSAINNFQLCWRVERNWILKPFCENITFLRSHG